MQVRLKFLTTRLMAPIMGEGSEDGTGTESGADSGGSEGTGDADSERTESPDGDSSGTEDSGGSRQPFGDWRDTIPIEIASEPTLQKFKDIAALAKSYVHFQRMQGAHNIKRPRPDATPEEWQKFYNQIGVPKDKEKYDVGQVENLDPKSMAALKEAAYNAGLIPRQANAILKSFGEMMNASKLEESAANEAFEAENRQILEKDWGMNFNKNIKDAQDAIRYFGGDEALQTLLKTPLANSAHVIKMFKSIADTIKEDIVHGNLDAANTRESTLARIDSIMHDPAYFDTKAANHNALVNEYEMLMKKMYGD